jgi:carboxyl-terminal processing protease
MVSGSGILKVNGVRMSQPGVTFKEKNVWYINLKLAAALTGGQLKYDVKKHEYTLIKGTKVQTIKTNDFHLKIKDGKSNIDVRLLAKWYPNFKFSSVGDTLKISAG